MFSKENMTNLLFICSLNKQRSPTAEDLFKDSEKHVVKSAGTSLFARKRIKVEEIEWADKIFVMEDCHRRYIERKFTYFKGKEIIVLDIPNIYYRNNPQLVNILKEKLGKYL